MARPPVMHRRRFAGRDLVGRRRRVLSPAPVLGSVDPVLGSVDPWHPASVPDDVPATPPDPLFLHADGRSRCWWCASTPEYTAYHDDEWGRPVHDDRALFEKISLEAFQSG